MSDSELKIGKFVDENTGAMVATLSSLVEIPSVKGKSEDGYPFGREPARALEKMLSIAKKMGFTTRNIDNYVGTIDFFSEGEPTLGILCHLDVVPEGSGWHTPPYSLTLSQGYLYARGVIDNKGPAVSVLYAMYALKKLGVKLTQNVRFIVGTDEENGSADLAYYKKKEKLPSRLFTPDGSYPIINLEKGMVRCGFEKEFESTGKKTVLSLYGGTVVNAVPESCTAEVLGFETSELEIAEKNAKTSATFKYEKDGDKIKITCTGKSAHASQPAGGTNALTATLKLLSMLKTDDMTAQSFAKLSKIFPFGETDGAGVGVRMSDEKSGALTLVHSIASYDGKKYSGKFDTRFPICSSSADVRKKAEKKLTAQEVTITEWNGVEPHYVSEDGDFIKTLISVYERISGKKGRCIAIGGGTYVHETEGGVAFGAEFIGDDNRMHGADERMSLELFKMNTRMFAEAIVALCK